MGLPHPDPASSGEAGLARPEQLQVPLLPGVLSPGLSGNNGLSSAGGWDPGVPWRVWAERGHTTMAVHRLTHLPGQSHSCSQCEGQAALSGSPTQLEPLPFWANTTTPGASVLPASPPVVSLTWGRARGAQPSTLAVSFSSVPLTVGNPSMQPSSTSSAVLVPSLCLSPGLARGSEPIGVIIEATFPRSTSHHCSPGPSPFLPLDPSP